MSQSIGHSKVILRAVDATLSELLEDGFEISHFSRSEAKWSFVLSNGNEVLLFEFSDLQRKEQTAWAEANSFCVQIK